MNATTVAIDLAKDVFEMAFADEAGHIVERKRLSRRAFAKSLHNRPKPVAKYRHEEEERQRDVIRVPDQEPRDECASR
jgi:hypothetical protein